ncbi:TMV resistance protein N-like protein [Tanacetum coccineum]
METRVNDVVSSLETGVDDVRMIGIKGIGGGGKTTLARAVFDKISIQFEGQSFVENVREDSKPSFSGLKLLQEQVLKDVLGDNKGIAVRSVHEGKQKLIKYMRALEKVHIVLDDVDNREQLEALAGEHNWFKAGSRIIITTRDEQVLIAHKVNLIREVNLLSNAEAIGLFRRYAFGRDTLIQGYDELLGQVVRYAAGLPLTIKVLGSFLCGKDEIEWEDAIERLKTIPLKETVEKLEISYIGLEEDYKKIFLDVACTLKGERKDKAIRALESCGFRAIIGLKVLHQKCLITISDRGYIGMHDHIEEMGRNIVRRSHEDEPNGCNHLWIDEEIKEILADDMVRFEFIFNVNNEYDYVIS